MKVELHNEPWDNGIILKYDDGDNTLIELLQKFIALGFNKLDMKAENIGLRLSIPTFSSIEGDYKKVLSNDLIAEMAKGGVKSFEKGGGGGDLCGGIRILSA